MYTPARSDLVALALAAIAAGVLVAVVASSDSPAVGVSAFITIPFTPLVAAWLSGPSHSMRSRFLQRGVAAVAGMAGGIIAGAWMDGGTADSGREAAILGGIIWATAFAAFGFVAVLVVATLLNLRAEPSQRPGD